MINHSSYRPGLSLYVKAMPKVYIYFAGEPTNLYNLIVDLRYQLEERHDAYYTAVKLLNMENEPLQSVQATL